MTNTTFGDKITEQKIAKQNATKQEMRQYLCDHFYGAVSGAYDDELTSKYEKSLFDPLEDYFKEYFAGKDILGK